MKSKHILIGIFALFSIKNFALADEIQKFRADFWCPYNCKPNTENPGYIIEILQDTFGKNSINYEELNWARSIKETREGKFEGIIAASKEDAPDFVFPQEPLGESANCFYVLNDSTWKFTGIKSLSQVTLGVVRDYAYFGELNDYIKANETNENFIQIHAGNDALIRMLQKLPLKRISALIEDPNVMNYALKNYPKIAEVKQAGCENNLNIYVAFSPKDPKSKERAEMLDKKIVDLKKSGKMETILTKYNVKKWY